MVNAIDLILDHQVIAMYPMYYDVIIQVAMDKLEATLKKNASLQEWKQSIKKEVQTAPCCRRGHRV